MFHIIKHKTGKNKGKFDFYFKNGGNYICGSTQGYDKLQQVYKTIISMEKKNNALQFFIQDNTADKPKVMQLDLVQTGKSVTYSVTLSKKNPQKP